MAKKDDKGAKGTKPIFVHVPKELRERWMATYPMGTTITEVIIGLIEKDVEERTKETETVTIAFDSCELLIARSLIAQMVFDVDMHDMFPDEEIKELLKKIDRADRDFSRDARENAVRKYTGIPKFKR